MPPGRPPATPRRQQGQAAAAAQLQSGQHAHPPPHTSAGQIVRGRVHGSTLLAPRTRPTPTTSMGRSGRRGMVLGRSATRWSPMTRERGGQPRRGRRHGPAEWTLTTGTIAPRRPPATPRGQQGRAAAATQLWIGLHAHPPMHGGAGQSTEESTEANASRPHDGLTRGAGGAAVMAMLLQDVLLHPHVLTCRVRHRRTLLRRQPWGPQPAGQHPAGARLPRAATPASGPDPAQLRPGCCSVTNSQPAEASAASQPERQP